MKIFLASVHRRRPVASSCGLLDGVLLSPSFLDSDVGGTPARPGIAPFGCPVIVSSGAGRRGITVYRSARGPGPGHRRDHRGVPARLDTVEALHRAIDDGPAVAASMVFSRAGPAGGSGAGRIGRAGGWTCSSRRGRMHRPHSPRCAGSATCTRIECEIIAVTPDGAGQVAACAASGVDAVAIEPAVLA